jgi:hypothetical protein
MPMTWRKLARAVTLGAAAISEGACGDPSSGRADWNGVEDAGDQTPDAAADVTAAGPGRFDASLLALPSVLSISVAPSTASLESIDGAAVRTAFRVIAQFDNGTSGPLASGVVWSSTAPQMGNVDSDGNYTANGSLGGLASIQASFNGRSAKAILTIKLHLLRNDAAVPEPIKAALRATNTADKNIIWAYPYDGTVWPRGLLPPILQWNGGAGADVYYIHIENATFALDEFAKAASAPASQLALDATVWQRLVDSSAGPTKLTVARWNGTSATRIAEHTWTIAPGSMRGTIYYWSNNLGRVLRIKPGAPQPDDFANKPPLNDPAMYKQSSCLMTCHTVSADGSTLISGGGVFGGSYDLIRGRPIFSLGGTWNPIDGSPSNSSVVEWSNSAVSPNGKYILTNAMAEGIAYSNDQTTTGFLGLYSTADGTAVPGSGLSNVALTEPAWSPEGSRIAFVDSGDPMAWSSGWTAPPPGDLKVYQFDETKRPMTSGELTVAAAGSDPAKRISWPTIAPDGKWVLYARGAGADTRSGPSDLYFASTVTPSNEVRLSALDGDNYPFAAGSRDVSWNFEPSFAPVAAGGYFWVVITTRRTYGNILTGPAMSADGSAAAVKQLWVAAIDESPKPGTDPSHPPFHLSGQDEGHLAMRAFWALDPCKQDGEGCGSGTECCGKYCRPASGEAGASACASQGTSCSLLGDRCDRSADCCEASSGVTCINHVCSEPTPG